MCQQPSVRCTFRNCEGFAQILPPVPCAYRPNCELIITRIPAIERSAETRCPDHREITRKQRKVQTDKAYYLRKKAETGIQQQGRANVIQAGYPASVEEREESSTMEEGSSSSCLPSGLPSLLQIQPDMNLINSIPVPNYQGHTNNNDASANLLPEVLSPSTIRRNRRAMELLIDSEDAIHDPYYQEHPNYQDLGYDEAPDFEGHPNHEEDISMGSFADLVDDFHRNHPDAVAWGFVGDFGEAMTESDSANEDRSNSNPDDKYSAGGSISDAIATAPARLAEAGIHIPQTIRDVVPPEANVVDEHQLQPRIRSPRLAHFPHGLQEEAILGTVAPATEGYEAWLAAQGDDLVNPMREYVFGPSRRHDGYGRSPSPTLTERIDASNNELHAIQAGMNNSATTDVDDTGPGAVAASDSSEDADPFELFTYHYRRSTK